MADHSTNGAAPLPAAGGSRRPVFVISLICAAQFVLQPDFSKVNVALPSIQRELGVPTAELQWIVTGYALAFGAPHDLPQTPPFLISQPPRPDRLSYHASTPLDRLTTRSSVEAITATC